MNDDTQIALDNVKDRLNAIGTEILVVDGTKLVAKAIVGHSVRFVMAGAISKIVPAETRTQKIKVAVATYAISGIVVEQAKQHVAKSIDEKVDFYRQVRAHIKKTESAPDQP